MKIPEHLETTEQLHEIVREVFGPLLAAVVEDCAVRFIRFCVIRTPEITFVSKGGLASDEPVWVLLQAHAIRHVIDGSDLDGRPTCWLAVDDGTGRVSRIRVLGTFEQVARILMPNAAFADMNLQRGDRRTVEP